MRLAGVLKKLGRPVLLINRPGTGHSTSYEDALVALEFMLDPTAKPIESVTTPAKATATTHSKESGVAESDWAAVVPEVENAK
jgi:hypothetical protein